MAQRVLTQSGMNRIMWKLLAAVGGKFVITNNELETINRDVGIRITHNGLTDTFTLQLHKIIQPGMSKDIIVPGPGLSLSPN